MHQRTEHKPYIHCEVTGAGSAIVFIHGFLCDTTLFSHQVATLEHSYRVLNIDIRGHGRSDSVDSPFTLYDLVDDVINVLDAQGVTNAIWVGLSMGGFVALRAAITRPDRVRALVLMGTEAGSQSPGKQLQDSALKWGLKILGPRLIVPSMVSIFLGKTTRKVNPVLFSAYRQLFLGMRVASICHCIDAVTHRDELLGRLSEIRCPTLVIAGDEDIAIPATKSRLMANGIAGAKLVVIHGAGHLCAAERPQAVNEAMSRFLTDSV